MKTTIFIKVYLRNWTIITCYDCKAVYRSSKFVMKSIKIPKTLDAYSYINPFEMGVSTLLNALLKHIYLRRLLVRLFIYLFLNIVILPGNFTGF